MSTAPEAKKADAKAVKKCDAKAAKKVAPAKTATPPATDKVAAKTRPLAKAPVKKVRKGDAQRAPASTPRSAHDESRLAQVLVAPIISEKATYVAEKRNQFLFKVLRSATKPEIKAAVELMFKVDVESVQTVQHKGKTKRFGKSTGRRDHIKKAYVSLAAGQELNFTGEAA